MKKISLKTLGITFAFICFGITFSNAQPQKERPKNPPTFSELLEEMDSGKDGKLSVAEVKGPLKENFADIDANEDGFITQEEFEKAPKPKRKAKRKAKRRM